MRRRSGAASLPGTDAHGHTSRCWLQWTEPPDAHGSVSSRLWSERGSASSDTATLRAGAAFNAQDALHTLIEHKIILINENDAVATDEIKIGDNDNLSALVAAGRRQFVNPVDGPTGSLQIHAVTLMPTDR